MNKGKITFLLILLSVFFAAEAARAQDKDDGEILRIDTQIVDVPVVVTDKAGKPLLNLKKTNFAVYEDGKPQELTDFSTTAAPFEVALLLDTSGSTRADLNLIQRAAANFIGFLRPGDKVSIIAYNSERRDRQTITVSEVLTDLTGDRAQLKTALEQARISNGTPYYDSLLQVVERVFAVNPAEEFRGRRALVALTDGVDSTSAADYEEVKAELGRAGIVCYFIQVDTREFFEENLLGDCESAIRFSQSQIRRYYRRFERRANVEKAASFCQLGDFERLAVSKSLYELANFEMQDLARISGGKVFPVADLSEARTAFKSVADEIGTKYSLGYYSSNDKRDGSYRKIKVELKGVPAGALVRAREGYTAPAN